MMGTGARVLRQAQHERGWDYAANTKPAQPELILSLSKGEAHAPQWPR